MESQLSFLATGISPVAVPAAVDMGPSGPASKTGSGAGDFAQVLTGETLRTQRQQLAALGAQDSGLQVVPLGSNMRVITSDAPLPDMESLAQFARQQGLNETAVQALFGPTIKTTMSTVDRNPALVYRTDLDSEAARTAPNAVDAEGAFLTPAAKIETAILATPGAVITPPSEAPLASALSANPLLDAARFVGLQDLGQPAVSGNPDAMPLGITHEEALSEARGAAESPVNAVKRSDSSDNPDASLKANTAASAFLARAAKVELTILANPNAVVSPQSASAMAIAPTSNLPLTAGRFGDPKGLGQPVVGGNATSAAVVRAVETSPPQAGAAAETVVLPSALSASAGAALGATVGASAFLGGAAKLESPTTTPSAVMASQGAMALASAAVAQLASLGSAPAQQTGTVLAAGQAVGLMPMTVDAWVGKASNTDAASAVSADAPPAPPNPSDALRLTLAMPAPEITKRLAQMSGTGKESTWAALLAAGPLAKEAATAASDILHLEVPPDYDLALDTASLAGTPAEPNDLAAQSGTAPPSTPAQAAASGSTANNANQAQAQAEHRAQQFQQLADQMGQAAAQRLIAQIERGQWKLQMRMQPAALGTIQVELDMHAGGLDASFSADQAITRELMVQGSNRLKETLTDAGMTVASVTVNRDQSRQSGGNSTPGKGRGTAPVAGVSGRSAAIDGLVPKRAEAAPSDGLNVLA